MSRLIRFFHFAIAMFLALSFLSPAPSLAADITVGSDCALADAIQAAESDQATGGCPAGDGADTLRLTDHIVLEAALPALASELTIDGAGYSISGNHRHRLFKVSESGALTLTNVTLRDGNADRGGAIFNAGALRIEDSRLNGSAAYKNNGGAIYNSGRLTIANSSLAANIADKQGDTTSSGGAIYNDGSQGGAAEATLSDTSFRGNWAEWGGGAIANEYGVLSVRDCVFEENSSDLSGGAIDNTGALTVVNSDFTRNKSNWGGAIDNNRGAASVIDSRFSANEADAGGGAIDNSAEINVIDSLFTENSADIAGGAIHNDNATLAVVGSRFWGNAADSGGAIRSADDVMSEHAQLSVVESSFAANTAEMGGAIFASGVQSIRRSSFSANVSTRFGGAMAIFARELTVADTSFAGNKSEFGGGGLALSASEAASLLHLTISNNEANEGAGLYVAKGSEPLVALHNSLIAGNDGGDCFAAALGANAGNLIADGSCEPDYQAAPILGELVEPEDGSPAFLPLLSGSPAIDAANSDHCAATDQIGTARPQGAACDIGAYEFVHE